MRAGATKIETTYYNNEVVKVMMWKYESATTGTGEILYEKAGWKQRIVLTEA